MLSISLLALLVASFQPLSARRDGQSSQAPSKPPIFPGRIYSTDLEGAEFGNSYDVGDVAVADMDRDGHVDVLVSRRAPWTAVSLLLGNGLGDLRCTSTREAPQGD